MEEKKKIRIPSKVVTVFIVVFVLVAVLAQSVLAVTPFREYFSNPFSFFSLNDSNLTREVTWTAGFDTTLSYGAESWYAIPSGSASVEWSDNPVSLYQRQDFDVSGAVALRCFGSDYTTAPYVDVNAAVNYSDGVVGAISLSGGGSISFFARKSNFEGEDIGDTAPLYPTTLQILLNGEPCGVSVPVSSSDGTFVFNEVSIPLSADVYSLGYRFTFSSYKRVNASESTEGAYTDFMMLLDDDGVFTALNYDEVAIGWLQNIWRSSEDGNTILSSIKSNISTGNNWLSKIHEALTVNGSASGDIQTLVEAISKAVETLNSISSTMQGNMESIQQETEKYNSIYASDTDLQLKEDSEELANSFVSDIFMNSDENGALPDGYTAISYIETDGETNYLDTGFYPDQDTRLVVEFQYLGSSNIYGARQSTAYNNFALRVISGCFQSGYNDKLGSTEFASDSNWHTADHNKNVFYLDGAVGYEFEYAEFTVPKSIILGGINAKNGVYYGSARFRTCKIYDNGRLVRDLLPCKNVSGEVGMFDLVSYVFIPCTGTEPLVAGDDVEVAPKQRLNRDDTDALKDILNNAEGLFDSGYSAGDLFDVLAGDDFFAWFTSDTASSLDAVNSSLAADFESEFDMSFYWNQIYAIQQSRGVDD